MNNRKETFETERIRWRRLDERELTVQSYFFLSKRKTKPKLKRRFAENFGYFSTFILHDWKLLVYGRKNNHEKDEEESWSRSLKLSWGWLTPSLSVIRVIEQNSKNKRFSFVRIGWNNDFIDLLLIVFEINSSKEKNISNSNGASCSFWHWAVSMNQ